MGNISSSAVVDSVPLVRVEQTGSNMQYRFSRDDLIGKGMFGIVYKARVSKRGDYTGENVVAVKVVHLDANSEAFCNTEKWARILSGLKRLIYLQHQHLVVYHKVSIFKDSRGATFELAMDYCQDDLASFLENAERNRSLVTTYRKVVRLAKDIAEGLDYLHQNNMIHGDLKPANILVKRPQNDREMLLIGDLDDLVQLQGSATCSGDITQLRGTTRYMSPEMLKKFSYFETESPGRKTDIWSLGCIMLEIAASCAQAPRKLVKNGIILDAGSNLFNNQYASLIINGYVPFVSADIPEHLAVLIRQCLAPSSSSRISARALLNNLRNKKVFVVVPWGKNPIPSLLILDPLPNSFRVRVCNVPTSINSLSAHNIQFSSAGTEIMLIEWANNSDCGNVKCHFINVSNGSHRTLRSSLLIRHMPAVVVKPKIYFYDGRFFAEMDIHDGSVVPLKTPPFRANTRSSIEAAAKCRKQIFYIKRFKFGTV